MSSLLESLCRICLEEGATIPIFEDEKTNDGSKSTVQNKLTRCLNEKFEDVAGYPRHICSRCQVTLNTVYDFINKYRESCSILQNNAQVVVKQEIDYDDYDDFVYPEDDIIETLEIKPTKKEIKIEFEDGPHFIAKISKLKKEGKGKSKNVNAVKNNLTKGVKRKSKKVNTVKKKTIKKHRITFSKNKTNVITSSLLEGEFVWNGEDWCPTRPQNILEEKKSQVQNERDVSHNQPEAEKRPPDPLLCEACGEKFKSRDSLRTHNEAKHKNLTVTCPTCKATFSSQTYLNTHFRRVHGTKKFFCSKCGKGFALKNHLKIHIKMVHEKLHKQKTHVCEFCNSSYGDKKSLIIHERSAHTGDRPAVCTVCDASFYHEDYLKEHMRLHTGERPFECPVCGRGYAQRGNMKSHMRNHRISQLDKETLSKIKPSWHRFMKP